MSLDHKLRAANYQHVTSASMSAEGDRVQLSDIEDTLLHQLAIQDAPHIAAAIIDARPWYQADFYNHNGERRQLTAAEAERLRHRLNMPHGIKDCAASQAKERLFGLTPHLDKVAQTIIMAGPDEKPDLRPLEQYLRPEHLPALLVVTKLAGYGDYLCTIYTEKMGRPC